MCWFGQTTPCVPSAGPDTSHSFQGPLPGLYMTLKWITGEDGCSCGGHLPFPCSVGVISVLQNLIDKGRTFSTIKVYLAAIAACHVGFDW